MYSLKLELKINNFEKSFLAGSAGFSRLVYNFGLSLLTASWGFEGIKATDSKRLSEIEKVFTNHVKTKPEYAWMNQYPSSIYSSAFRNLASSVNRWRKGDSGFPKFKSKKRGDSFTVLKKSGIYPAKGEPMIPFTNRQLLYPGKKITIPGLGEFRLKQPIPFLCSSQTFTISRLANKWFVSFALDVDRIPPIIQKVQSVGIDLGVKCFATLSDGNTIVAPQSLKTALTKLSKDMWRNRNKLRGNRNQGIQASRNALKYYQRLAKRHARIANIRRDFLHKTTTDISLKYYNIRIEDLNVQGMIANHKLALAISSLGFYEFRRMLIYKSTFFGTKVELVDRWFPSSKTCCCCGNIQAMPLSERVYRCHQCGISIDRDLNAAINLENSPKDRVRAASAEFTPADKKEPTPKVETGSKRRVKRHA
ncbi:RNA-guided endonuclease InsQ/TnpB family protein [Microseira wollei]|uniref:Transposase n=1 Tax=Microseira wollei NIES-4236 TaxID=2530354 RepID=A0AAV3X799_9CYAN|nr:transposase [Microseira wollei]GET37670.1 transposase [Microseira wollei NIES-4236]